MQDNNVRIHNTISRRTQNFMHGNLVKGQNHSGG
jgi:hypothetical protein